MFDQTAAVSPWIPEGGGVVAVLAGSLAAVAFGLMEVIKAWIGKRTPVKPTKVEPHIEKAITTNLELANRNLEVSKRLLEMHTQTDSDGVPRWYVKGRLYRDVEKTLELVKEIRGNHD